MYSQTSFSGASQPVQVTNNGMGGLEDLLGGLGLGTASDLAPQANVQKSEPNDILNQFYGIRENGKRGALIVNEKGIEIQLFVDTPLSSGTAIARMICSNNNPVPVENFVLQAAVTKVCYFAYNTFFFVVKNHEVSGFLMTKKIELAF